MLSDRAIGAALEHGGALLKVISKNDAGDTSSHQYGFHLPKPPWKYFAPFGPERGRNDEHPVRVTWPDGLDTPSIVKWYGSGTRSEYRLTKFGRDFPHRSPQDVGGVLVLVRDSPSSFLAFVLRAEEEILEVQAALGVDITSGWALYEREAGLTTTPEGVAACLATEFARFSDSVTEFPTGEIFTDGTWQALRHCDVHFDGLSTDDKLSRCVEAEYELFRFVERKIYAPVVLEPLGSVDAMLTVSNTIMQRRKSRAGRSLENHVGLLLRERGVPFDARPHVPGRPDIVIPSAAAYEDPEYPEDRLFVVPIKTTCRDRWRQVLEEGPRVKRRYLVTTQRGISQGQLALMHEAGISLVVPEELHDAYPETPAEILMLGEFIELVRDRLREA